MTPPMALMVLMALIMALIALIALMALMALIMALTALVALMAPPAPPLWLWALRAGGVRLLGFRGLRHALAPGPKPQGPGPQT